MAGSVNASLLMQLTATETLDPSLTPDADAGSTVTHRAYNLQRSLNAGSTPPASKCAANSAALVAGAAIIDLTALNGTNGVVVDATALAVCAVLFRNPATNTHDLTFKFGAATPYNLLGANWQITLEPGDAFQAYLSAAPAVGSGAKHIDVGGTGTDTYQYQLVLG